MTDNDNEGKPAEQAVVRGAGGRWIVPPRSPGRPRGPSQAEMVRKLIEPHRTALIDRALALTQSADPFAAANALRICLERLAPAPKQEAEKVEVPGLADAPTFAAKCECIVAAVAAGEISAEAGEKLLRMVDVYRRAVAHDALEARIAALEGKRVNTIESAPEVDDGGLL